MITFPNCKINLGLHILRKRSDGYHDIETIFYPVPLSDILEIIESKTPVDSSIQLTTSGIPIQGKENSNLCVKAYNILLNDFPSLPSVLIHLHKFIPTGAGLGGGSSDAAFTFNILNKIFKLDLSTKKLMEYALKLGSDCPYFLVNNPCYATGQGEILEKVSIDLSMYKIMLVNPGIHVDTGHAFANSIPTLPADSIKEIIKKPVAAWKKNLFNDFEKLVFQSHQEIADIKKELYHLGALYASMSGSGSTVYGIFEKDIIVNHNFPPHYFIKTVIS